MRDWEVLIVEDDPLVASLHRAAVTAHPGLRVTGVVTSAEQALLALRRGVAVDLLLLDLCLPGPGGGELVRALRAGPGPEVIVITATRSRSVVQRMLQLGVVDYLLKPCPLERLQLALSRFCSRMSAFAGDSLEQDEIDLLCAPVEKRMLPKGVDAATLGAVRRVLGDAERPLTASEISVRASLARVTARRYLEYLVTVREAACESAISGPGRPTKRYRTLGESTRQLRRAHG